MSMARKGKRGMTTVTQRISPNGIKESDKNGTVTLPAACYAGMMKEIGRDADGTTVVSRNEQTDYVSGKQVITFSTIPGSKCRKRVLRFAHGTGASVSPLANNGEYYVECCKQWWTIRGSAEEMQSFLRHCVDVIDIISGFSSPDSNGKHTVDLPFEVRMKRNVIKRQLANCSAAIRLPDSRI